MGCREQRDEIRKKSWNKGYLSLKHEPEIVVIFSLHEETERTFQKLGLVIIVGSLVKEKPKSIKLGDI